MTAPLRGDGNDDDNLESTVASYGYDAFVNNMVSLLDGNGASHCGNWGGGRYTGAIAVEWGGEQYSLALLRAITLLDKSS